MKKAGLFRAITVVLAVLILFSLSGCDRKYTPEEAVRKELVRELRVEHGLFMQKYKISEINVTVVTSELMKEWRWLYYDGVRENDVVFGVTYDVKTWDFLPVECLSMANGEEDGHWVRNAYFCGYLKYISEGKYELLSMGTGF